MDLFPYTPRAGQRDLMDFISEAVVSGKHAVIESGTGTGKTICSLSAVLGVTHPEGRKVVYLTRTKSQQKQVIAELREISRKVPIMGVAIQGRNINTCPMMADDNNLASGSPAEMSRLCSELKRKKNGTCSCKYFASMEGVDIDEQVTYLRENTPDQEEMQARFRDMGLCPYEMAKLLIPFAEVVVIPYTFLLSPEVRRHFLTWMNVDLKDLTVIADEAHNLPDFLREQMSSEYTLRALNSAEKEADDWSNPTLSGNITAKDIINAMRNLMRAAIKDYVVDDDGILPTYYLEEEMMCQTSSTSLTLKAAYEEMSSIGEMIRETKKNKRKLPRSYMGSLADFLITWGQCEDEMFVKLVNGGDAPSFEVYCMDPYEAAAPLRDCASSIHMSGTLEPLTEYSEELGLESAMRRVFPSPFDLANLKTVFVDDVTTKHDVLYAEGQSMITRMVDYVASIIKSTNRNTAVFFPSYGLMDILMSNGLKEALDREVFIESPSLTQSELMETVNNFRISGGGILLSVFGGRISEGLDFPDSDLEVAVLIGIPYPYPTAKQKMMVRYCEFRFGNGWEHAVRSPVSRKIRQARGRLIRSESDRGIAVMLDQRIAAFPELGATLTADPRADVVSFFGRDC